MLGKREVAKKGQRQKAVGLEDNKLSKCDTLLAVIFKPDPSAALLVALNLS